MKQKIICIVGPSGSGKTTLAQFAEKELGMKVLVSYTTRPKRDNEIDGVDHYFVSNDQVPPKECQLAYTRFGGYQYWTDVRDLPTDQAVIYVIDEKGLMMLIEEWSHQYTIDAILIKRNRDLLIKSVGEERVKRDKCRVKIDEHSYDAILSNNGSLLEFLTNGIKTIKLLTEL